MKTESNCETCANFVLDEQTDCYICDMQLDEDEMLRFLTDDTARCPYYNFYDEYKIVRKQN